MSERTFMAMSAAAVTTAAPTKIAIAANTLKVLQQIHAPWEGPPLRVIEWGVAMDGSTAAPGVQAELIEVDVGSTGGTSYKAPVGILNTALTSGTTTVVPFSAAGFPASGNYLCRIYGEDMLVTAGQGTLSWTVTRAVNNVSRAFTIPSGATIAGLDCPPGDIVPDNDASLWVPSRVAVQLATDVGVVNSTTNVQQSGFNFGTPGTPTRTRTLSGGLIVPSTAPWAIQEPLARESEVTPGNYLQVRLFSPSGGPAPNCLSWIRWAE